MNQQKKGSKNASPYECIHCGTEIVQGENRCPNCLMLYEFNTPSFELVKKIVIIVIGGILGSWALAWIPLIGGLISSLIPILTLGSIVLLVRQQKKK